jgi:hypothetical protein
MNPFEVVLLVVVAVAVLIAATIAIARVLSSVGDERVPAASDPDDRERDVLAVDLTDRR